MSTIGGFVVPNERLVCKVDVNAVFKQWLPYWLHLLTLANGVGGHEGAFSCNAMPIYVILRVALTIYVILNERLARSEGSTVSWDTVTVCYDTWFSLIIDPSVFCENLRMTWRRYPKWPETYSFVSSWTGLLKRSFV